MPQNHGEMTPNYGEMIPNHGEMTHNLWGNDSKLWANEAKYYGELPQRQSEYTPTDTPLLSSHLRPQRAHCYHEEAGCSASPPNDY